MCPLALAALIGITPLVQARAGNPRIVIPLNEDWRFHPGALDGAEASAIDQDLCYVRVEAVDADGRLAPHEMREVTFALDGPATVTAH